MSDAGYRYVAVDAAGRRVRGQIGAAEEAQAYASLRAAGLAPIRLRKAEITQRKQSGLRDQDAIELASSLGHLLSAGADMRTSLQILGARAPRPAVEAACRSLSDEIGGGGPLDGAFARALGRHGPFIAAMLLAGETAGDIGGGLLRAAEILETRSRLRSQLVSVLAYPGFVLVSSLAAVLGLLLFVVPSLVPMVQDSGAPPPLAMKVMIAASDALQSNMAGILASLAAFAVFGLATAATGHLARWVDRALLSGPTRRTASGVVYGSFAVVLGGMLGAGAPMSEALRLAVGSVGSALARRRLDPVVGKVRQGQSLSAALESVKGFPTSVSRLTAVGEATGSLGPMLVRAGKLEEDAAMARIGAFGAILGPALIVGLGGVVGLLMAGLLSGVSQLGQSALQ